MLNLTFTEHQVKLATSTQCSQKQESPKGGLTGSPRNRKRNTVPRGISPRTRVAGAVPVAAFGPVCSFRFLDVTGTAGVTFPHHSRALGIHPSIKPGVLVSDKPLQKNILLLSESTQSRRTYPTQSLALVKQCRGRCKAASAERKPGVSGTTFLVVGSGGGPGPLVSSPRPNEMVCYQSPKLPYSRSFSFPMSSSVSGVQPPQEHRKPYVEYSPMVDPP